MEYDEGEPMNLNEASLGELCEWCMGQESWEVTIDHDLDKAATKIQGQARRRRDAQKVEEIKGNKADKAVA